MWSQTSNRERLRERKWYAILTDTRNAVLPLAHFCEGLKSVLVSSSKINKHKQQCNCNSHWLTLTCSSCWCCCRCRLASEEIFHALLRRDVSYFFLSRCKVEQLRNFSLGFLRDVIIPIRRVSAKSSQENQYPDTSSVCLWGEVL